jgi:hypothetical protein
MEVTGQLYTPVTIHPLQGTHGTNWIGGWESPWDSLDAVGYLHFNRIVNRIGRAFKFKTLLRSTPPPQHAHMRACTHTHTLVLDKHSSPHALFKISNVPVAVFFKLTWNIMASLCSILKTSTWLHQNICAPNMNQPNRLKFAYHINKCSL